MRIGTTQSRPWKSSKVEVQVIIGGKVLILRALIFIKIGTFHFHAFSQHAYDFLQWFKTFHFNFQENVYFYIV